MNNNKKIQFPSTIFQIKTMADGGIRLVQDLPALPDDEATILFSFRNKSIFTCLAETEVKKEELDIPDAITVKGKKSDSKKLRDRMFVFWQKMGLTMEFNTWYEQELNRIGNAYLDKIT